jgi:hypothetical protein
MLPYTLPVVHEVSLLVAASWITKGWVTDAMNEDSDDWVGEAQNAPAARLPLGCFGRRLRTLRETY